VIVDVSEIGRQSVVVGRVVAVFVLAGSELGVALGVQTQTR
jgi:hypothetical protein